jgi:hypothetical protein
MLIGFMLTIVGLMMCGERLVYGRPSDGRSFKLRIMVLGVGIIFLLGGAIGNI